MTTAARPRPPRRTRRIAFLLIALLAAGAALAPAVWLRVRAARVLLATLDSGNANGVPALPAARVRASAETIALADGTRMRSLRYQPAAASEAPQLLLLHGVHPLGIDEPRLQRFARALAAGGLEVHTPELPELLALDVDTRVVARIAACAAALRARSGRKAGAIGISFTGGLLLIAASRPGGADSFGYVVAIGAHADVRRVARRFAGEPALGPNGEHAAGAVDPYGARVLAAAYAPLFFAPGDVQPARAALRAYLAEHYAQANQLSARLSAAGTARLRAILARDSAELRRLLGELARSPSPSLAALSPAGQLSQLRVPTLLLHGAADPIVPSTETLWLAREVPSAALERALVTPALRHAESSGEPTLREQLALVDFVAAILAHAR